MPTMRDGKQYGMPFGWGSLPLVYDKAAVPGAAPDSWEVMWDPANSSAAHLARRRQQLHHPRRHRAGIKNPFNLTDAQFERSRRS